MKTDAKTFAVVVLIWMTAHWIDAVMTIAAFAMYPGAFVEHNTIVQSHGWLIGIGAKGLDMILLALVGTFLYWAGSSFVRNLTRVAFWMSTVGTIFDVLLPNLWEINKITKVPVVSNIAQIVWFSIGG